MGVGFRPSWGRSKPGGAGSILASQRQHLEQRAHPAVDQARDVAVASRGALRRRRPCATASLRAPRCRCGEEEALRHRSVHRAPAARAASPSAAKSTCALRSHSPGASNTSTGAVPANRLSVSPGRLARAVTVIDEQRRAVRRAAMRAAMPPASARRGRRRPRRPCRAAPHRARAVRPAGRGEGFPDPRRTPTGRRRRQAPRSRSRQAVGRATVLPDRQRVEELVGEQHQPGRAGQSRSTPCQAAAGSPRAPLPAAARRRGLDLDEVERRAPRGRPVHASPAARSDIGHQRAAARPELDQAQRRRPADYAPHLGGPQRRSARRTSG